MVLQSTTRLFKKRILHPSNSENTPPSMPRRVSASIREASRRRRARVTSGSHTPLLSHKAKYVYDVKHRKAKPSFGARLRFEVPVPSTPPPVLTRDIEMKEVESVTTSTVNKTVTLPRHLSRPDFQDIDKDILVAIDPELAETPIEYIQDGLEAIGHDMYNVLLGAKIEPVTDSLPKELTIVVNDLSSEMPSHILAVCAQPSATIPSAHRDKVTLFPAHNIVTAAHCAHLPRLPSSSQPIPATPGSSITVPVVPLCIPSPEMFNPLFLYLYTKRIGNLLRVFLPVLPSVPLNVYITPDETSDEGKRQREGLLNFARGLAFTYTPHVLLCYVMRVNSFWRNVCSLGVFESQIWAAMDFAWEVLILAMAISTGSVEQVIGEPAVAQPVESA